MGGFLEKIARSKIIWTFLLLYHLAVWFFLQFYVAYAKPVYILVYGDIRQPLFTYFAFSGVLNAATLVILTTTIFVFYIMYTKKINSIVALTITTLYYLAT